MGADPANSRTILVGAPDALRVLSRQLWHLPQRIEPIGCVPVGEHVPAGEAIGASGPVLGQVDDLAEICRQHDITLAIVSIPAAMHEQIRQVRAGLRRVGVAERFVPPMVELLSHAPAPLPSGAAPGRIDHAALLGRRPHAIDREAVGRLIEGRRVLITGAGGSIGSELARIAAGFSPERLILMERSENALFEIDRQLAARFPGVERAALLHDVVERERTLELVDEHAPHAVFHAAAHKHVPLMEDHPAHALTNNVFGTASIADASLDAGVGTFVLISTDKAVHPSSVMGATKRLAELYVQGIARDAHTGFAVVRFGNVLGSAGSVLPIWSAQLAEGEPITVTDERMTRYFMTIPEAAALVTQAGAMTSPGEAARMFVLDMGEPVSILDLAKRFVEAHAMTPRVRRFGAGDTHAADGVVDARVGEIIITGARPGEKLEERLAYLAERLAPSDHPGIRELIGEDAPTAQRAHAMLASLDEARTRASRAAVLDAIASLIPGIRAGRAAA
ncbi:MAG: polysaccharide biosynthesis protein [Phycisphaerales bacterium]